MVPVELSRHRASSHRPRPLEPGSPRTFDITTSPIKITSILGAVCSVTSYECESAPARWITPHLSDPRAARCARIGKRLRDGERQERQEDRLRQGPDFPNAILQTGGWLLRTRCGSGTGLSPCSCVCSSLPEPVSAEYVPRAVGTRQAEGRDRGSKKTNTD